jgi:iron-sulfur cluster repair protein YtfE (RIC family)
MKKQDAIALLKEQHEDVKKLLDELASTTARGVKTRKELLSKIEVKLKSHMRIEEEILYPAYKNAVSTKKDEKLYYEAVEEHHAAAHELKRLNHQDPATVAFGGMAKVLKELVEHHVEEEEKELFPKVRELISKDELVALGEKMRERFEQIQSGKSWDRSTVAAE